MSIADGERGAPPMVAGHTLVWDHGSGVSG